MKKFVMEYKLHYAHISRFGVHAEDAAEAGQIAQAALDDGLVERTSAAFPLLSDDWDQLEDGFVSLDVHCECLEGFPPPDATIDALKTEDDARTVCRALVRAYKAGRNNGGSIDWDDIDQIHELACSVLGVDPQPDEDTEDSEEEEEEQEEEETPTREEGFAYVSGSCGTLKLDPSTGEVIQLWMEHGDDGYKHIRRFDLDEHRRWAADKLASKVDESDFDILEVGYWLASAQYEPASNAFRDTLIIDHKRAKAAD